MPNSLRVKLSKLRYKGQLTNAEYTELINKLDEQNKHIYNKALEDLCNKLCSNGAIADFMKDYIREKAEELMK